MAIITAAILQALNTGYRRHFQDAYAAMRPTLVVDRIATTVPSSGASNTYGWLGDFPQLREWIGARVIKDMKEAGYEITNKLYEGTVGVARTAIEDDQYGVYAPLIQSMGQEAAQFPDRLIANLMQGGAAGLCYDGQNFFDTDHPVFPNHDGTGAAATVSNYDAAGGGPARYLLDTRRPIKPFIYQERTKPEFDVLTDAKQNDQVFMTDTYFYGTRYRANAGYGFWQMAYRSHQPLTPASYQAAKLAMRKFTADGGKPLGINPSIIVVNSDNEAAAKSLFDAMLVGGGNTNPHYKDVEIVVSQWLP